MGNEVTLRKLKNQLDESWFQTAYTKLALGEKISLNDETLIRLLKTAILFCHYGDANLKKFGYKIILAYSLLFRDFQPLYDIAINLGYYPIVSFIDRNLLPQHEPSFIRAFNSAITQQSKSGEIFLSAGQKRLHEFAANTDGDFVLVAPTSYGKSEIIVDQVFKQAGSKICVVVPSKALLAQTKKRIVEREQFGDSFGRVITHPDMYKSEETGFVAVLTQERLLRLLQKNIDLSLDILLIDEAHNLLSADNRATLLAQVIIIAKKRNENVQVQFFTPFISDVKSLETTYADYSLTEEKVKEHLKVERFYCCDLRGGDRRLWQYDQFLNSFSLVDDSQLSGDVGFLRKYAARKNIVYINRPRDIIALSKRLAQQPLPEIDQELRKAMDALADYVHPDYDLLDCLRAGLVYHHGGMPENVRLYVESSFAKIAALKFVVTSSTLLEGVNIPAEKIFVLTAKIGRRKFTHSQFKNLIGRVARFSEIFHPTHGDLDLLEPSVYLVKGEFEDSRINPRAYLEKHARVDLKVKDSVENVLLKKTDDKLDSEDQKKLEQSLAYLENIEPETIKIPDTNYATTDIGKLCFQNNVYDFNIRENETQLESNLSQYQLANPDLLISSANEVMDAIFSIFIEGIEDVESNLERLQNQPARNFYAMFLNWRSRGASYNEMVGQFVGYWSRLSSSTIFVGKRWGEVKLNEEAPVPLYVDLSTKSQAARVNLAILRIKEEQDFVDNQLMKYVEILNDLHLVRQSFYEEIKYGTSDQRMVTLLKQGFSTELAKLIVRQAYRDLVDIDPDADTVNISPELAERFVAENVNQILVFELRYHVVVV